VSTAVNPGSGVNLGTITLVGNPSGATITSIPLTVTPGSGGSFSNLSNCQIFNSSGLSVTSGTPVTIGSGSNAFNLNAPLNLGSGTTTLTVRCDVSASTASGSTFQVIAGTPTLTPSLNVNLDTAPSVPRGSTDVALANISVGGLNSGGTVNVRSIPLTINAGSGGSVANLANCRIRDTQNVDGQLTAPVSVSSGTATTFVFSNPLSVFAGTAPMLALACDVQPATPIGSTFTISADPGSVSATNSSGGTVTATPVVGVGPNGLPASLSGTVIVTDTTGTGTGTTGTGTGTTGTGTGTTGTSTGTPGIPNTGVGDVAQTFAILAAAALIALASGFYLRRSLR
ncbi:MAG: hypothetical protein JO019_02150, partial [Candidatus Kaiserbacteria bacterium]|nr:hypothetical protein [Candidatus Kaiserbacteria bacterium]